MIIEQGDSFKITHDKNDTREYKLIDSKKFIAELIKPSEYQLTRIPYYKSGEWKKTARINIEKRWFTERGFIIAV